MALSWRDTPERYGLITRALHWGMAGVFAWQFLGMALRNLLGRGPVAGFFVSSHTALGTVLLLLVLLRGAWGLYNRPRRPPHGPGWLGRASVAGHLALYGLMLLVPSLALLRAYGSGRAFSPFGVPLFPGFQGGPIGWMTAPGNAAHGLLAWVLLALIAGHIVMAVAHRVIWRDDVLQRMAGRVRQPAAGE
ncbi:cytochrome b [Teichococcus deserti]|uniref:cytochrome b n=1 Tax=Teichococcus deserti TaxID=1817963 RepID=UPI001F61E986|nr:cytochrome b [Pseudoroseomonas deserti]